MGMKPRLDDGPVQFPGVVNNPMKIGEKAPMPQNLVNHTTDDTGSLERSNLVTCTKK